MKIFICMFTLSVFSLMGSNLIPVPDDLCPAEKLVNKILADSAEKLTKKYPITCVGEGASMPGGVVESIHLAFNIYEPPTKEEARKLIIESSQDFLQMINSYHELAEYAPVFPFSYKNIELTIFIIDQKGRTSTYPNLSTIGVFGGKVQFWTYKKNPLSRVRYTMHSKENEDYDESLKIVQSQTNQ